MRVMTSKLAGGSLSASAAAFAQAAPSTQTAAADADEILVTADRRTSSIQDVPISITALSGDTLETAGIRTTKQLSDLTPGLLVQRSVVGKVSIRGVCNENYTIAGDPGVAVHSDGVYVARASAGLFDLFDIARAEVLRGPQGTLYGRNAAGGVIAARARLAPHKVPKDFSFLDELPRGPTGKVLKRALREAGNSSSGSSSEVIA